MLKISKKPLKEMLPEEPVIILRVKKYFLEKFHFIQQNPFLSQIIDLNFKQITPEIGKQIMQLQEFEFKVSKLFFQRELKTGNFLQWTVQPLRKLL